MPYRLRRFRVRCQVKLGRAAGFVLLGLLLLLGGGLAWIRVRGFRASSKPSGVEVAIAHALRSFAIPPAQGRRKNPHPNDELAVEQGRELFLARCAGCHGVDGRGATPIGGNLYPRVPDLRASATQGMSDGELHYIIENGVQLTGMPAMPGLRLASGEDVWAVVSYVRTLRTPTEKDTKLLKEAAANGHYVGSQSCAKCHASIYERWKKTPMANVVRDPRQHPDAILGDLNTNDVSKFTVDQVAFVYGSLWKQRFFTKVGDDYYPLPVQWDVGNKKWMKYHVPDTGADWWAAYYPSDNMQRPTGPTCDGCHSVGYDIHTKQVAEWNVGCERCHGPGSEHVAHPTRTNIQSASQMNSFAANDTCIQCHSQGQPKTKLTEGKAYDWPVGYELGGRLADHWNLEEIALGQTDFIHYADGTGHKNRMQGNDFVQSVMYEKGVTCASCHDVHGTGNYAQLRKPANELCLDCHAANGPNGPHVAQGVGVASLEQHTHHKAGSAGSQCIACHMPKIETEGVPGALVRSHTFRFIPPAMTDRYKIPNSCTTCHTDKSTEWAAKALSEWTEMSPWRVASR